MAKILRKSVPVSAPASELPDVVIRDVSVQRYLLEAADAAAQQSGYTRKQRSRWIEEAIAGLAIHDPTLLASPLGEQAIRGEQAKLRRIKVQLSLPIDQRANEMVKNLLAENPDTVGPYSYVVRCALRYRLRNPARFTHMLVRSERDKLLRSALPIPTTDLFSEIPAGS